jgi:hypothetical protein
MIDKLYFLLLLSVTIAFSQHVIDLPYIEKNTCPFEYCKFGTWISESIIPVYKNEGSTDEIISTILPNDTLFAITGNLYLEKIGFVVVIDTFKYADIFFLPGDTLYPICELWEGYWDVVYKGKIYKEVFGFWLSEDYLDENPDFKYSYEGLMIKKPIFSWWVNVNTKNIEDGWIKLERDTTTLINHGFSIKENIRGMSSF